MKKYSEMFFMFIYFNLLYFINSLSTNSDKIIISLTSDKKYIYNSINIINSILEQNIYEDFFGILLMLSIYEFKDKKSLPEELQTLEKSKKIKIKFIKDKITNKLRRIFVIKENRNNPILIINNNCKFPDGWLKMFLNDHLKYPNDAIAASIRYYFGKNDEITELSEGYKGEKFGIFNHIIELIFNFAIIEADFGGILYPKNYFQNSLFYDKQLNGADISEEFWESAFIIIEDKILRQSSKIFDYTKYLLNESNTEEFKKDKRISFEKDKVSFIKIFPNFYDSLKKRKRKIIVSITSYPKRFIFLQDLMSYIKNQSFIINNIFFFLYKNDTKYLSLDMKKLKIISTNENLRPHLKYFYAMKLFRDHAIITLDDDIGYTKDTFESLFNAYIDNPNVISGRRSHLMKFDNNGELKSYFKWLFEQKLYTNPEFNLVLTNVAGSIYPPDILNIKDEFLPIIKETITCDDLTLKYFENIKGIPIKWINNDNMLGYKRRLPKVNSLPLYSINQINNDICINKLNLMINETILTDLCVQYRNISTGNIIYLFDIHNKFKKKNILYFELYAYSYCPIDLKIKFNIFFDNFSSNCTFQKSKLISIAKNTPQKINIIASCNMYNLNKNLDDFINPSIKSINNTNIKIFNYRKYSTIIFKNFYCIIDANICFLKAILFEEIYNNKLLAKINDKQYLCHIEFKNRTLINFPIIINCKCHQNDYFDNNNQILISGIPKNVNINKKFEDNNIIPNQFFIHRIYNESKDQKNILIISGKLLDNLQKKMYYFSINVFHPIIYLNCILNPNSKFVLSKIYCISNKNITSNLLIENQIIHFNNNEGELLIINEETIIKINLSKNKNKEKYQIITYNKLKYQLKIFLLLLIIMIKFVLKK